LLAAVRFVLLLLLICGEGFILLANATTGSSGSSGRSKQGTLPFPTSKPILLISHPFSRFLLAGLKSCYFHFTAYH